LFISPFIGGGIIESKINTTNKLIYDKNSYLMAMYKELQNGWIPPKNLTKEEYYYIKNNKDEKPYLTGFVGFGCSFAGKWFGGYAFDKSQGKNYCQLSSNSLMKKYENGLTNAVFDCKDYRDLTPHDAVIYCDPPYQGTTTYGAVGKFDSEEFWEVMRKWSKDNIVFISEYNSPDDFKYIWEKKTTTQIRNSDDVVCKRLEKLFVYSDN